MKEIKESSSLSEYHKEKKVSSLATMIAKLSPKNRKVGISGIRDEHGNTIPDSDNAGKKWGISNFTYSQSSLKK